MSDALYLLDGYSLVYRSYFAFIRRPLFNPRGKNASAIYGFFRSLFLLIADRNPSHFAVVMDSRTPTFRHDMYEDYKATREKTPGDLKNEIPVIEEILEQLGVAIVRVDGFEADDLIATLATKAKETGRPCYVVSGDKDLLQLVDGPVRILKPESGGGFTEMDREGVVAVWGVTPEQILDYLALVGDSSDNIPGVKGIGEKTAASLLAQFPDLDSIYENIDELPSRSQREKLISGRESAYLSRDLARLEMHVPVDIGIDDLKLGDLDRRAAAPYFAAEGMRTLVKDMVGVDHLDLPADDPVMARANICASREMVSPFDDPSATLDPSGAVIPDADLPTGRAAPRTSGTDGGVFGTGLTAADTLFTEAPTHEVERPVLSTWECDPVHAASGRYELITTPEGLDRWCDLALEAGCVAFDCETNSLDAMRADPVGFSLAVEPCLACYVALHGPDGPVLRADVVLPRLKRLLEDARVKVIGQNLKYDYKVMARYGVRIRNPWFDTMVAAWLLDTESNRLGMDSLAEDYLGYRTLHYRDVVPKAARGEGEHTFDEVNLEDAMRYAAEDADITLRLARVLEPLLAARGLDRLFHELEMPLLPLLAEMEMEGIRLDRSELDSYSIELERELGRIEREIYSLVGHEFNIGSTKQLQEVLFVERKLARGKKTKTGYSTDTSVLQELALEDPVPALVLRNRMLSKLKSTYVDSLPTMINPLTGRIHTHFNINGTATGRISSTDPNLQNIPIRDEEGRRIRRAFVPREGWVFVSADYSQIELVVLAHLSGDPGLRQAFAEGIDVHRHTGSLIFGVRPDDVSAAQRRIAKTINFGVMYGMSAFRLARELGIPRRDADSFIEAYFSTYSRIRTFIDETISRAERRGYVETILGRRRYLANISNRNKTVKMATERVAVNTPIQGSAADIMKRAMIDLSAALRESGLESRMLLQVHDELILECPPREVEPVSALLREIMTNAVTLSIPLQVSVETGASWGELH